MARDEQAHLVSRLLPQLCYFVFFERFLEQFRQALDGLLQIVLVVFENERLVVLREIYLQLACQYLVYTKAPVSLTECHGIRPFEHRAATSQSLDRFREELNLDPRQRRVLLNLLHLALHAEEQFALELDRILVVGVARVVLQMPSTSALRIRAIKTRRWALTCR